MLRRLKPHPILCAHCLALKKIHCQQSVDNGEYGFKTESFVVFFVVQYVAIKPADKKTWAILKFLVYFLLLTYKLLH